MLALIASLTFAAAIAAASIALVSSWRRYGVQMLANARALRAVEDERAFSVRVGATTHRPALALGGLRRVPQRAVRSRRVEAARLRAAA